MNRFLVVIAVIFASANFAFSQTEGEDLVQLKNGTSVRGIIIEQRPGEFIRVLQIPSQDTVKIMLMEIETLLKIVPNVNESEIIHNLPYPQDTVNKPLVDNTVKDGFNQHLFQVRINMARLFLDYAGEGYGFSLHRKIGSTTYAGVGFSYFKGRINLPYQDRKSLAFFGEFSHDIGLSTKGRLGFRGGLGLGYNIDFSESYFDLDANVNAKLSNGLFAHPHVGLRMNLTKNTGLLFDIGYQYIHANLQSLTTKEKIEGRNWSSTVFRISLFF